jgi:hypothetical protein
MATHIVSWGGNEHVISPVPSSTPSIVSVDPVLSHERETSSAVQEATGPAPEFLAKQWSFLSAEPRETSTSASTYQTADTADDSFTRHNKYFFKDGNVTFLVRGVSQESGVHIRFISEIVCRLMEHFIVSTDISFLGTLSALPPCLTSSASVTTKPSLSPYH